MAAKRKAAAARPKRIRRPPSRGPATRKAPAARRAKPAAARTGALRLAGVGTEAVRKATGRAWDEWLKALDGAGARAMAHKDIALMLSRRFNVPDWWSQMVTVGYEQARGLRKVYQKAGGFSATASRTVAAPLDKLYAAWSEPRQRSRWLMDAPLEIRRSTDGKSMRMTWTAGNSSVVVGFSRKGAEKSVVALEHAQLPDAKAVGAQKDYWGKALDRLKALLEGR
jgi:uncharacterized protein YndB with AHSA1/START domain